MAEPGRRMTSSAPWPAELDDLVVRARDPRGWVFKLRQGEHDDGEVVGLRLEIITSAPDSYDYRHPVRVSFEFAVPAVTWNRRAWQEWLFDRLMDVHRHEAGEGLAFEYIDEKTGRRYRERPFAPFHGPGCDQTRIVEVGVAPAEQRVAAGGGDREGWWLMREDDWLHTEAEHLMHYPRKKHEQCIPVQVIEP